MGQSNNTAVNAKADRRHAQLSARRSGRPPSR